MAILNGVRHPLARALAGSSMDATDVAARLGVDPKTVSRWLAGRVPYPRHRAALAQLTGWTVRDLWPDLTRSPAADPATSGVRLTYPRRCAVPPEAWRRHFAAARHDIGILAYSAVLSASRCGPGRSLRRSSICEQS